MLQLQEIIKKSQEQQEETPLDFGGEPPKDYILKRDHNLWIVENLITGQRKTLAFGDRLEFYNNTECHTKTGRWISTCMGEVTSWTSSFVNIGYRERSYNYIMANGTKFYNFYPVKMQMDNVTNSNKIIVCVLFAIVAIYTIINLYSWLG